MNCKIFIKEHIVVFIVFGCALLLLQIWIDHNALQKFRYSYNLVALSFTIVGILIQAKIEQLRERNNDESYKTY